MPGEESESWSCTSGRKSVDESVFIYHSGETHTHVKILLKNLYRSVINRCYINVSTRKLFRRARSSDRCIVIFFFLISQYTRVSVISVN